MHSNAGEFYLIGTTVFAEIQGVIEACVRLTGMPDLTLSFMVGSFSPLYFNHLCSGAFCSSLNFPRCCFIDRILVSWMM